MKASDPRFADGRRHATRLAPGDLSRYVLLPGDPARLDTISALWDSSTEIAHNRSWRTICGEYRSTRISAVSTGVGGPSAEVALVDLAHLGCDTLIRVGTTGSIQEHIHLGDLIINTACIRWDGTSEQYVDRSYPAAAHYEVVAALVQACERLGYAYHLGVGATAASFFVGQGRPAYGDYLPSAKREMIQDLQAARVTNIEMEGATVMTLSSLFGLRAGMICTVVADRVRNQWSTDKGQKEACEAASLALSIISEWDEAKRAAGKQAFYPALVTRG